MAKQVYRSKAAMAGVRAGEHFEAESDDPRVLSGYAEVVKPDDVPEEVAEALAAATTAPSNGEATPKRSHKRKNPA